LRLVLRTPRLGLVERGPERPGIDEGQDVPRLDYLAFGEIHALQLAANRAVDRDRVGGLYRAEAFQIDRHVSHADLGNRHRDGERLFSSWSGCLLSRGTRIDEYQCGNQCG